MKHLYGPDKLPLCFPFCGTYRWPQLYGTEPSRFPETLTVIPFFKHDRARLLQSPCLSCSLEGGSLCYFFRADVNLLKLLLLLLVNTAQAAAHAAAQTAAQAAAALSLSHCL
ncbi:hypothetical protein Dimus_011813 [Dionaea muscipula]